MHEKWIQLSSLGLLGCQRPRICPLLTSASPTHLPINPQSPCMPSAPGIGQVHSLPWKLFPRLHMATPSHCSGVLSAITSSERPLLEGAIFSRIAFSHFTLWTYHVYFLLHLSIILVLKTVWISERQSPHPSCLLLYLWHLTHYLTYGNFYGNVLGSINKYLSAYSAENLCN